MRPAEPPRGDDPPAPAPGPATESGQSRESPATGRGPGAFDPPIGPRVDPPSLPKPGGTATGLGETFEANAFNGTASLTIPLPAPPARAGTPALALAYDSGRGSDPFGWGWALTLPSIERSTRRGLPRYLDDEHSDTFVLAGAEDLVPVTDDSGRVQVRTEGEHDVVRYRPRVESGFARIERWTRRADGDAHWRVTDADNATSWFGRTADSRVADPQGPTRVFRWLVDRVQDDRGNVTVFEYVGEDARGVEVDAAAEANRERGAQRYLARVRYGNRIAPASDIDVDLQLSYALVFDYGDHGDALPPPEVEQIDDVAIPHEPDRDWDARLDAFSTLRPGFEVRTHRRCRRVLALHHFDELGATPQVVRSLDLHYDDDPTGSTLAAACVRGYVPTGPGRYRGRGLPPVTLTMSPSVLAPTVHEVDVDDLGDLGGGVDGTGIRLVDLDGEGLPGILATHGRAWTYKRPEGGGGFGPARALAQVPVMAGSAPRLTDLDGDGVLSVVSLGSTAASSIARDPATDGWSAPRSMTDVPVGVDLEAPAVQRLDVTGDGLADLLVDRGDRFDWYRGRGRDGYAAAVAVPKPRAEDTGPQIVYGDDTVMLATADMTGDGLSDLVRVEASGVVYWPNRGYGRFGAAVRLAVSQPLARPGEFSARRVRLADIDGTGPADLVVFDHAGAAVLRNASGNRLLEPVHVDVVPPVDTLAHADVVDLEGTGSACIVWSSSGPAARRRPIRYARLHAEKPRLLVQVDNGLGGRRRLTYRSSTAEYLRDRAAGTPWQTRLPFAVQVVTQVETTDAITGHRYVQTYSYHHGYFDGVEREFRGFARVDRRDAESFVDGAADDGELVVPPVLTRTWFHTGAYLGHAARSRQLAAEYWRGDPLMPPLSQATPADGLELDDTVLPSGLTAAEAREALRALRGSTLRTEVFAEDGTPEAADPYLVAEANFAVRLEQAKGQGAHAVFFVHPRESLSLTYDRVRDDPRVAHELTLEVDAFGVVRRRASVAYPRRVPVTVEQAQLLGTIAEVEVVHQPDLPDRHRLGTPIATQTLQLLDLPAVATGRRLSVAAIQATATERVAASRTSYWADDLSGPLPPGEVGRRALPFEAQALAMDTTQATELLPEVDLAAAGYVVDAQGVWARSGRATHDPEQFFLPVQLVDPFGNATAVTYLHGQFVVAQTDALGNSVSADIDLRTLAARAVVDPNGNVTEGASDELGRVVAVARRGMIGVDAGDTLDAPTVTATYDGWAFLTRGAPASAEVRTREVHADPNTRWQVAITYTSGTGEVVQDKVRVAAGPVPHLAIDVPERWVGTGRTIRNNKGDPVKQYEPYFSDSSAFESEATIVEQGVTPILRYDPIGRLVRTDFPDGTFATVRTRPWRTDGSDRNDNAGDSDWHAERMAMAPGPERRAAVVTQAHHDTPTVTHFDPLGRATRIDEDLGGGHLVTTQRVLDIVGNERQVVDARGNVAESRDFGRLGQVLRTVSVDAGTRRVLTDTMAAPHVAFDSRGQTHSVEYDALRRPTHQQVTDASGTRTLVRNVYGEDVVDANVLNLRGRLFRQYDGAGLVETSSFDFDGNPLVQSRTFVRDAESTPDWSGLPEGTPADVATAAAARLEEETFTTSTTWDALGRPVEQIDADGSITRPTYEEGGRLQSLTAETDGADPTLVVHGLEYDARGRRTVVRHGSGTTTRYTYDPRTFRLRRIRTLRDVDGEVLQDVGYHHDPSGHVVARTDEATQAVFFASAVEEAGGQYVYDALYRLVEATGREHRTQGQGTPSEQTPGPQPHPSDPLAMRRYTERYVYDDVGNLLSHRHEAPNAGWTRTYAYAADGNRLLATGLPGEVGGQLSGQYEYDAHGNMTSMPHLEVVDWDALDRMAGAELEGGGRVSFQYDASGNRVRKLRRNGPGTQTFERVYVGGVERFRRRVADTVTTERWSLHVADDTGRICLVDRQTVTDGATVDAAVPLFRYQLSGALGSVSAELDGDGRVISYEEFHPYGTSAYRAVDSSIGVSARRYRYTGKERDEETGLDSMGVRYYAAWLGRWTSTDPIGIGDGVNRFAYVSGNPVGLRDPSGTRGVLGAVQQQVKVNEAIIAESNRQGLSEDERHKAMSHPLPERPTQEEQLREQVRDVERQKFENEDLPLIRLGKKRPEGLPPGAVPVRGRTGIEGFKSSEAIEDHREGVQHYTVSGTPVGELEYDTTSLPGEFAIDVAAGGVLGALRRAAGFSGVLTRATGTGEKRLVQTVDDVAGSEFHGPLRMLDQPPPPAPPRDPGVPELTNALQSRGVEVKEHLEGLKIFRPDGSVDTDLDVVTELGVVQVKTGGGKGATAQAVTTDELVDLPVAVFDANALLGRSATVKGSVEQGLRSQGFELTRDVDRLIEILRSGGRKKP